MFNHFHDIITGSGTADTREYALGQVQRSLAVAGTEETQALRRIAAYADTSSLGDPHEDARSNLSEGAGAGWGVSAFGLSHVERGRGRTRIFHVFNPLPWTRTEVVEAVIWDWPGDPARLIVRDAAGGVVPHQVIPNEIDPFQGAAYWGHQYLRVLVVVTVPGCGYTTCSLGEGIPRDLPVHAGGEPRVQRPPDTYWRTNGYAPSSIRTPRPCARSSTRSRGRSCWTCHGPPPCSVSSGKTTAAE